MPPAATARVVIFRPGQSPEIAMIDTSLAAIQALVGGYVGGLQLPGSLFLYFDDDARTSGKATCAYVDSLGDVVVGVCIATGIDDAGEIRSLTEEEIEAVKRLVVPVAFVARERFQA